MDISKNGEQTIVEIFIKLKNGGSVDFNLMSETLFAWSKKWITENSCYVRVE